MLSFQRIVGILSRPGDLLFGNYFKTIKSSSFVNGDVLIFSLSEILILGSGWSFSFGGFPSRDLKWESQLDLRFSAEPPLILMVGFSFRPDISLMTFHRLHAV